MDYKIELKTGNKVILRNGEIGLVFSNVEYYEDFIIIRDQTISINDYVFDNQSNYYKHKNNKNLDIIDIKTVKGITTFFNIIHFENLAIHYWD